MAKYVLIYHGGDKPQSEAEGKKMMMDWEAWVTDMGDNLVDPGTGVGMSKTVMSDGSVVDNGGTNPFSGYSCIRADNMEEALSSTKKHPFLSMGGSIEIAEEYRFE